MTKSIFENILKLLKAEFTKFVFVGGISAVIEFSLLILFVEKLSIDYLFGNVFAFALTNIVTYILTKRFVFNGTQSANKAQEAGLFFLCLLGGLVVNQIVLWAVVEFTAIDYRIAKVIAIAITVIWNFFTRKHLVFRNRAVVTQQSSTEYSEENL
ncbi:GtrA family protein [Ohtaekwangia koreensis]|uniref:Putative flippase GtrA (Transmembrane translocase of bactoprenol-linked glucose) n=1 Tax=Ohtaekwangia koreensis TaxID=688867 RepID=A0A1T5JYV2_9BACT|nr:GtrA family protein [Ohtaekwangia koreensis]SKC56534.1 Putative flippase GtrA (transmembrane translocase of bactoprenol-linked glucose) [Ohtaekwangia koreensis]